MSGIIVRETIVNRLSEIFGYELFFKTHDQLQGNDVALLSHALTSIDSNNLIDNKLTFVEISRDMFMSDFLDLTHPNKVVIEIPSDVEPSPEAISKARKLKAQGFSLALKGFGSDPKLDMLPVVNFVKVDISSIPPEKMRPNELSKILNPIMKRNVKSIAENVQSKIRFKLCSQAGFDAFQGYFFSQPESLDSTTIQPSITNIMVALNLVNQNANIAEIEKAMKLDVAMSYKLFSYINSVSFSLYNEIKSIREAISILGYQKLYRWLTLLMVTVGDNQGLPPALIKTAITRGSFAEQLGKAVYPNAHHDDLFIAGFFSLLDVILNMPMKEILNKLLLSNDIRRALLNREGMYGLVLQLVEACEDPYSENIITLSEQLGLSLDEVNQGHLRSMEWADKLLQT